MNIKLITQFYKPIPKETKFNEQSIQVDFLIILSKVFPGGKEALKYGQSDTSKY